MMKRSLRPSCELVRPRPRKEEVRGGAVSRATQECVTHQKPAAGTEASL